jgi:hypothetical protein
MKFKIQKDKLNNHKRSINILCISFVISIVSFSSENMGINLFIFKCSDGTHMPQSIHLQLNFHSILRRYF